jgi:hypothetical protein
VRSYRSGRGSGVDFGGRIVVEPLDNARRNGPENEFGSGIAGEDRGRGAVEKRAEATTESRRSWVMEDRLTAGEFNVTSK